MKNILIDTNILREEPMRSGSFFHALRRLAQNRRIKLHIPYIVQREFQTQQIATIEKNAKNARSGISGLIRLATADSTKKNLSNILEQINAIEDVVKGEVNNELLSWANEVNAKLHSLTIEESEQAMEAYFTGGLPLKEPKVRNDIPDSFVFQKAKQLKQELQDLTVIVHDNKLAEAFEEAEGIEVFRTLKAFIEHASMQRQLLELDIIENLPDVIQSLRQLEEETGQISCFIRQELGEALMNKSIIHDSIPDDNGEAFINGYYDAHEIELNMEDLAYYSNGEFGIEFQAEIEVNADFCVFKADAICSGFPNWTRLTDRNKHYFESEDTFSIRVSGTVSVGINWEEVDLEDLNNNFISDSMDIASIEDIELVSWRGFNSKQA